MHNSALLAWLYVTVVPAILVEMVAKMKRLLEVKFK